jgi:hypothetical protein
MLSKTERSYISGIFSPTYAHKRVLDHRINKKLKDFFRLELPLIQNSSVTDFSNSVTEFTNTHCTEAQTSREATRENGLGGLRSLDL